ncbi:DUF4476 domain-containing protein [Vibrio gigantis]|uniref:DUF4476 domain-containing protein n=1 Tax=Vibrio gigantis TaxID=296199 RepID=UPI001EFBAA67|nr:DUF4476 domain-containing protein [Vibrio gigantis]ULN65687.1 DUF4476 domain-containing protein [Vibrio gigantis]
MFKLIMSAIFYFIFSFSVQAMEPEELLKNVEIFDFDSTKNKFVSENVNTLNRDLTFKELIKLVKHFEFDSSKVNVVKVLRGHHGEYSDSELLELMEALTFDSSKDKILNILDADADAEEFSEITNSKSSLTITTSENSTTLTIRCNGFDCQTEYVEE